MQEDEANVLITSGSAGGPQGKKELLQITQEAGHLGLFEWLVQAGTLRLSPKFLLLYGLPEFDGLYQTWLKCIFREDIPRLTDLMDNAFAENARHSHAEFRIVRPCDGGLRRMEARHGLFYDAE